MVFWLKGHIFGTFLAKQDHTNASGIKMRRGSPTLQRNEVTLI